MSKIDVEKSSKLEKSCTAACKKAVVQNKTVKLQITVRKSLEFFSAGSDDFHEVN